MHCNDVADSGIKGGKSNMWRPRDHERYIGGYDPEHEMPDPDRDRGGRWQSDAYRHNSRDTRFAYRWNPERFENRFADRDRGRDFDPRWNRDARDNYPTRPSSFAPRDRSYGPYGGYGEFSDYERGGYRGNDFDRGDYSRGFDYERNWNDRSGRWSSDDRWNSGPDYDRAREFGGRGYERDWRDRQRFDNDRGDRGPSDYNDDYDRWRNRGGGW